MDAAARATDLVLPPSLQRRDSILQGIGGGVERPYDAEADVVGVLHVAVPAIDGRRGVGAELDDVAEVRERIRPGGSALLVLSEPLTKETVSTISAGDPHVTVLRADVAPSDEGTPAG